jgi:DNA-directed RNA polymerase specialized sigma24 family protein
MFVMHYFDNLSRDEIATTLGTTSGAVSLQM